MRSIAVLTADAMEQPADDAASTLRRPMKYRDFLRAFWRLSEQDGYPVVLREFEQVIS